MFLLQLSDSDSQHTHPFCGRLFNAEDFDSFGQMELMVFKVRTEERGLCARVRERDANITDHRGLLLFDTKFSSALLEHNLERQKRSKERSSSPTLYKSSVKMFE